MIKEVTSFFTNIFIYTFFIKSDNLRLYKFVSLFIKFFITQFLISVVLRRLELNNDHISPLTVILATIFSVGLHIIIWAKDHIIFFLNVLYNYFINVDFIYKVQVISLIVQFLIGDFCFNIEGQLESSEITVNYIVFVRWLLGMVTFLLATNLLETSNLNRNYKLIMLVLFHWFVIDYWGRDMAYLFYAFLKQ